MRESISDVVRALAGKPQSRRPPWKTLRGRLWLDHAMWLSGLAPAEFARKYIERDRSASNLFAKWRAGIAIPGRNSAISLERQLPNTLWLFDLPLFPLLADEPIPKAKLKSLTEKHIGTNFIGGRAWRLPDGDDLASTTWWSTGLVYRGDIWGLYALIGMIRWSELEGDLHHHLGASQDAFRALPALLRLPWAAPSVRQLYELIERIRNRMPYSDRLFRVDWDVIESLASRPDFIADRDQRPRGVDGRFMTYPDPIIKMNFVPRKRQEEW